MRISTESPRNCTWPCATLLRVRRHDTPDQIEPHAPFQLARPVNRQLITVRSAEELRCYFRWAVGSGSLGTNHRHAAQAQMSCATGIRSRKLNQAIVAEHQSCHPQPRELLRVKVA